MAVGSLRTKGRMGLPPSMGFYLMMMIVRRGTRGRGTRVNSSVLIHPVSSRDHLCIELSKEQSESLIFPAPVEGIGSVAIVHICDEQQPPYI
jgi:hypothetical protein